MKEFSSKTSMTEVDPHISFGSQYSLPMNKNFEKTTNTQQMEITPMEETISKDLVDAEEKRKRSLGINDTLGSRHNSGSESLP